MSEKMNVLFIMTDQHRADHMNCSGNSVVKTPNLDRLAEKGLDLQMLFALIQCVCQTDPLFLREFILTFMGAEATA